MLLTTFCCVFSVSASDDTRTFRARVIKNIPNLSVEVSEILIWKPLGYASSLIMNLCVTFEKNRLVRYAIPIKNVKECFCPWIMPLMRYVAENTWILSRIITRIHESSTRNLCNVWGKSVWRKWTKTRLQDLTHYIQIKIQTTNKFKVRRVSTWDHRKLKK